MTVIQVKELGTNTFLPTEEGGYSEPSQEINRGPEGKFKVADYDGTYQALVPIGRVCEVYEDGVKEFVGIVKSRKRTRGVEGFFLEGRMEDLGYHLLRATPCDPYAFSETGKSVTDRDTVKVNPWDWSIFRSPFGNTLDVDGNQIAANGVPLSDAINGLAGKRFVFMHRFSDDRIFRVSDLLGTPGSQVRTASDKYDTGVDSQPVEVPSLQRLKGPLGYITQTHKIRTIPLESGDPNVTPMGNVTDASIIIIGKEEPTSGMASAPLLDITRNARDASPTWQSVPLTRIPDYNGSGLVAWVATNHPFIGAPAGNSVALRFFVAGVALDETTRIYNFRLSCALASLDTGLAGATVATYTDPVALTLDKVWVDDDFEGLNRADALERVRQTTITLAATNPSPHWDLWVDVDQVLHFAHRRGADLTDEFSLDDDSITVLDHEEFGEDLCYQVIAEGGGTGANQFVITDRVEFTSGGLYSSALDPSDGATYGQAPRAHVFRDQGSKSRSDLRRRARAYMRDRLVPRDYYSTRFIPFGARPFVVGDSVILNDAVLAVNTRIQVTSVGVEWSGTTGHTWKVSFGHHLNNPVSTLAGNAARDKFDKKAAILSAGSKAAGGPGINCDATHYGRTSIVIPDGVDVERVLLTIRTLPFQGLTKPVEANAPVYESLGGDSGTLGPIDPGDAATQSFTFDQGAMEASATTDDGFFLRVFVACTDTAEAPHYEVRLLLRNGGPGTLVAEGVTTFQAEFDLDVSAYVRGIFIPAAAIAQLAGSACDGVDIEVRVDDDESGARSFFVSYDAARVAPHTHRQKFGIYQFDGDDGDGDGDPVLAQLRFALDPILDPAGQPTQFTTDQHPETIGNIAGPVTRTLDVTPYLRRQADGRIAEGEHEFMAIGIVGPDNDQGLATCAISTRIKAAEANG